MHMILITAQGSIKPGMGIRMYRDNPFYSDIMGQEGVKASGFCGSPWSMVDGPWCVVDDVVDSPWLVVDGRWSMVDGPWLAADGVVDGPWLVVDSVSLTVGSPWAWVDGMLPEVICSLSIDGCSSSIEDGLWAMVRFCAFFCCPSSMDHGPSTMGCSCLPMSKCAYNCFACTPVSVRPQPRVSTGMRNKVLNALFKTCCTLIALC